jgi:hypothetical protein
MASTFVERLHWRECVERYDRPHSFFYMDPPYWKTEGYGVEFPFAEYEAMADVMRKLKGKAMLSINDHPDTSGDVSKASTWRASTSATRWVAGLRLPTGASWSSGHGTKIWSLQAFFESARRGLSHRVGTSSRLLRFDLHCNRQSEVASQGRKPPRGEFMILQEIQKWSLEQEPWMQDAIARLYSKTRLDDGDYADVYAILKAQMGIPDPQERQPAKFDAGQIAAPQVAERLVQLAAIRNLRNVNALAEGQSLPIAPTGLTVIYGENGAGKSGYSRVLKKACRARDQREPILGNANHAPKKGAIAQASFDLLVDGSAVPPPVPI